MLLEYTKRIVIIIVGMFLYALGIFLTIQANLGLAPWDALNQGLTNITGMSFGTSSIVISVVILLIDVALKEKIGVGTIINSVAIGLFVDMLYAIDIIPTSDSIWLSLAMLLGGMLLIAFATYLYIKAGLGAGARDGLMVALCKRLKKWPVGAVRALLEGSVLGISALMGAPIGVGTVITVLGLGFATELVFRLFHFNVRSVVHESVIDTVKIWKGAAAEPEGR